MKAKSILSDLTVLETRADLDLEITALTSDSEAVVPGALFVALSGTKTDGHDFVHSAASRGASLAVVEKRPEGNGIPYVLVEDTRAALPRLCAAFYGHPERRFSHIIGVTGTNGKTSVTLMLRHVFSEAGHRVGLLGTTRYFVADASYESTLTTPAPEELFFYLNKMIEAGCDTLVMEVSSHALSQHRVDLIPFDVGVFTNLTQDHLDYHGTMEAYLAEKAKLFSLSRTGLFNADDPAADRLRQQAACPVFGFGTGAGDFEASDIALNSGGVSYSLRHPGGSLRIGVPIPGRFTVFNSMAAAAAALLSGIPPETVAAALTSVPPIPGRMERLTFGGEVSVVLDYAHTPDALEKALIALRTPDVHRIFTVFGCGGDRDRDKRAIMGRIACEYSDFVLVTSDNPRSEDPEAILRDILKGCEAREKLLCVDPDRTRAIECALSSASAGDVVLLAGKGHEEYVIDKRGKHPYSEREIVRQFYREKRERQV